MISFSTWQVELRNATSLVTTHLYRLAFCFSTWQVELLSRMIPIFLKNKIPIDISVNLSGVYAGMTQKQLYGN